MKAHQGFFKRKIHAAERFFFWLLKGLAAFIATVTLVSFAVFSKLLCCDLAVMASHFVGLLFD